MRIKQLLLFGLASSTWLLLATQLNAARMVEISLFGSGVEVDELLSPDPEVLASEDYEQPFIAFSISNTIRVKISIMVGNDQIEDFYNIGINSQTWGTIHFKFYNGHGHFAGEDSGFGFIGPESGDILTGPGYFELAYGPSPFLEGSEIHIWAPHVGPTSISELEDFQYAYQTLRARLTSVTYHVPDSSGPAALLSFSLLLFIHAKLRISGTSRVAR
ncbi:hypothetical protein [Pelagicoccus sp. SDUM812002]|uniref:hypothetical protein n=1 Tax=Pelagicoccus sp. SDUM812002 TaxID=3041266 RepID=UPI00280FB5BA|nr:hypothetical protein [Pelagicoccus sp. SDUM812002]MDQ8185073.1 hypothetical protein [Pelagicoccus sp. SDUM812002]